MVAITVAVLRLIARLGSSDYSDLLNKNRAVVLLSDAGPILATNIAKGGNAMNVAVTVWGRRISPVVDAARTLLIVEIQQGRIVEQSVLALQSGRLDRLIQLLTERKIATLLCGALCANSAAALQDHGIEVVSFLSGDVHAALQMWVSGQDLNELSMPGCRWGRCRFGRNIHGPQLVGRLHCCNGDEKGRSEKMKED